MGEATTSTARTNLLGLTRAGLEAFVTAAAREGAEAVICASTGNTAASAAAYAARAGMTCAVLVPDGKIAAGKLALV